MGYRRGTKVQVTVPNQKRFFEYAGQTMLGEISNEFRVTYEVEMEVGPSEYLRLRIRKNDVRVVCPICGTVDSARTPIFIVSNAPDMDPARGVACRECISKYDGTYGWDGDRVIYV